MNRKGSATRGVRRCPTGRAPAPALFEDLETGIRVHAAARCRRTRFAVELRNVEQARRLTHALLSTGGRDRFGPTLAAPAMKTESAAALFVTSSSEPEQRAALGRFLVGFAVGCTL